MNEQQKKIAKSWSWCEDGKQLADNFRAFGEHHVVCLERFIFTTSISIIESEWTRRTRWCYATKADAKRALEDWEATEFKGMPKDYIKQKPEDDIKESW